MSLFNIFSVSGSALSAQSQRLNTVASNLANAESTTSASGEAYRAKHVVFEAVPVQGSAAAGVRVKQVVEDAAPLKMTYSPGHPNADANGYVQMSNVNVVDEMVNMISASRTYQNNVEVMNTTKTLIGKTLSLGQ